MGELGIDCAINEMPLDKRPSSETEGLIIGGKGSKQSSEIGVNES